MRESLKEYNRRMMREWRARKRQDPEWLAAHRKKECARVCAYYAAHPDKRREHWAKFVAKSGIKRRTTERVRYAVKTVRAGLCYKPCYCRRKPDWMPVGRVVLDVHSQWLAVNLTDAQRAYARELAIERKERRSAR